MNSELPFTILGSSGWIGSALYSYLLQLGHEVTLVGRQGLDDWLTGSSTQGLVIFSIGLTSDFRAKPHETCKAHVDLLSKVLQRPGVDQLIYLSSTRVYSRSLATSETTATPCLSADPSDLYNLSKLLGESLVLQDSRPMLRVVRLSNVVGKGQPCSTFVGALIAEAQERGQVTIRQPPSTEKDYVLLSDVVRLLPQIAQRAKYRIYNLGSGFNTSHAEIADWLRSKRVQVEFASQPDEGLTFRPIQIGRLQAEFDSPSRPFTQALSIF
jgi:nucleoside-diphosphate-sugar epimerase